MRDDLGFGGGGGGIRNVESDLHGGSLSGMRSGLSFRNAGKKGAAKRFGIKAFDREATSRTAISGFASDIGGRRRMPRENRERGIFGTDLIDIVKTLEVPGLDIDRGGVPFTASKNEEKLVERLSAMDFEIRGSDVREGRSNFGPGEIFAQEENLKRRVVHASCEQLLAKNKRERS